ncbi:MAG TPA: glycosyltransferase family 9 protein, partial [Gemmatimonadaceae bacterium]
HAAELLRHSGLADDVVVYDLPWTALYAKYDPRRYDMGSLRALIRQLSAEKFDLSIDARMDARSNLLTWMIGARRRVGFDYGGGSVLLTDAIPVNPNAHHRIDDWLTLVRAVSQYAEEKNRMVPFSLGEGAASQLAVSDDEIAWAEGWLAQQGFSASRPLVVIHGGASDPRRRWPLASYEKVARAIKDRWNAEFLFFPEPADAYGTLPLATATARVSLREMMALLSRARLVLCNDSGPMHIADALGVPVVAVFLTGNPKWHRPSRPGQRFVGEGTGHDFLIAPTEQGVIDAADALLAARSQQPAAAV